MSGGWTPLSASVESLAALLHETCRDFGLASEPWERLPKFAREAYTMRAYSWIHEATS